MKVFWSGGVPLGRSFWIYAILYGAAANMAATITAVVALAAGASTSTGMALFMLSAPYLALAVLAVWRSAARYQGPTVWADLARAVSLLWVCVLLVI